MSSPARSKLGSGPHSITAVTPSTNVPVTSRCAVSGDVRGRYTGMSRSSRSDPSGRLASTTRGDGRR
jgi:hypothetical protein